VLTACSTPQPVLRHGETRYGDEREGVMRRYVTVVAVLMITLVSISITVVCGVLSEQKQVSAEAREQIVGSAKVVHESESGTNGHVSLQVLLFVLDLGNIGGPRQAVDEEARRLKSAGWNIDQLPSGETVAYSEKANATATMSTLADYFDDSQVDLTDLKDRFPDASALIVVSVEPRT
jgi:hypothetical protein